MKAFAAFAALLVTSATPVLAYDPDNTMILANAITEAGVNLYTDCGEAAGFVGIYASTHRTLAVCANGRLPTEFTPDEQDTLRHEAIHLSQDCMGVAFDGELETTRNLTSVFGMVAAASDRLDFGKIENSYRLRGSGDMTVLMEFEAWSGAMLMTNKEVAGLVQRSCRG